MVLRVGVEDGKELTARTALMKAARGLGVMFKNWANEWASVGGTAAAPANASVNTLRNAIESRRQSQQPQPNQNF